MEEYLVNFYEKKVNSWGVLYFSFIYLYINVKKIYINIVVVVVFLI